MRRVVIFAAITAIGLILLLTFRSRAPDGAAASSPIPSVTRPTTTGPGTSTPPATSSAPVLRDGTHRAPGRRVHTDWGYVQVAVRIAHRRIVDITAVELPHGNPTDVQISRDAAPQLRAAALAAQSAHIDTISGLAIATSGTAERGLHVVDPHSGAPAVDIASLTVIEPDLATADALATAGVAMGRRARDWLESVPGHVALAIMADGRTWRTGRLRTDDAKVIEAHPVR